MNARITLTTASLVKHAGFDHTEDHMVPLPVSNGETPPFAIRATLLSEGAAVSSEKGAVAVSKFNDHHPTGTTPGIAGNTPTEGLTVSLSVPYAKGAKLEVFSILDCNMDGAVDILDSQVISNQILGIPTAAPACDTNLDRKVDVLDAQAVLDCILGVTCG